MAEKLQIEIIDINIYISKIKQNFGWKISPKANMKVFESISKSWQQEKRLSKRKIYVRGP